VTHDAKQVTLYFKIRSVQSRKIQAGEYIILQLRGKQEFIVRIKWLWIAQFNQRLEDGLILTAQLGKFLRITHIRSAGDKQVEFGLQQRQKRFII